jgi:hypothetical protein
LIVETHVVKKPFTGPGVVFQAGARVDGAGWKNIRNLERFGYVRPILATEVVASAARPIQEGRGRKG